MSRPTVAAGAPRTSGPWYLAAELGCLALGLALALSTVRLFSDRGAVANLCLVAAGGWALAVATRRSPLPGWLGDLVHLGIGVLVLLAVAAPTERWGFLPGPDSVLRVVEVLRDDFQRFDQDIAPMVPRSGHVIALAALLWVLALFCSTAAMRFRSPVQAAVPHVVAFVGLGFVARSSWRYGSAALLLVALALYALCQIAWRNGSSRWVPTGRHVAAARFGSGAALALAGALVAALATPLLPVGVDPVLDLRRGGLGETGPRTVVSPFVEVGANLGERSDQLLFTMESDSAQYWRLTSLDTYDPDNAIWVLSNSYQAVSGPLSEAEANGAATELEVRSLGGIWIPSPADPVEVDSALELNWDPRSQSLIKRSGELDSGDGAGFLSAPTALPDPAFLAAARPSSVESELLDTAGVSPGLAELAAELSSGRSPYESLLALQDHFRDTFEYDEGVDFSGDAEPIEAFLEAGAGFCQQFSTAFALGAREMGFPARVVVGFTPGDTEPGVDSGERTFAVRGRHAHAWPEVLFEGIGWVPFEPTPGRGNPAATEITGVAADQAAPPEGTTGLEELAPETTEPEAATTTTEALEPGELELPDEVTASAGAEQDDAAGNSWVWVALAALVVALGSIVAVGASRRRRGPAAPTDPVQRSWHRVTTELAELDLAVAPAETPLEYAQRCNAALDLPALRVLAGLESARRWSGTPTSESSAREARDAEHEVLAEVAEASSGTATARVQQPESPAGV